MCCCAKPNVNGEPGYSWDGNQIGIRPIDPPTLVNGDVLLYDEPGRCGGLDSHCHHYRLVKNGGIALLVRHGGGDERIRVSLPRGFSFEALDSNSRYWLFNALYHAYADGRRTGTENEYARWRQAAAERRIKVRKVRGANSFKVFLQPKETTT